MAQPPSKPAPAAPRATAKPAPAKPAAKDAIAVGEPAQPVSRLSWFLGWVVAPLSVLGAIYGGGVLLGAHSPDGWFARSVMWVASIF